MSEYKSNDLSERFLDFSVEAFEIIKLLPYKKEFDVIRFQLSKSSTSIGANYEESQATTKREFPVKIRISLREALETRYWLRFIVRLNVVETQKIEPVLLECIELIKILKSILSKTDN